MSPVAAGGRTGTAAAVGGGAGAGRGAALGGAIGWLGWLAQAVSATSETTRGSERRAIESNLVAADSGLNAE
jgi:hypothetical protein